VEAGLARGDKVTTLNRGVTGTPAPGAEHLVADRTDVEALRAALAGHEWDAVIDTWNGAPRVVHDSCRLLAGRVGHFGYVSSRSVYRWPVPVDADERAPVVDGAADDEGDEDYAAAKRGAELAAVEVFDEDALLARAGLILGPYEQVGRMPWWLRRLERGGRVLAPGPRDLPLQYIDARDLAAWMLSAAERGLGGAFNTVSRPGHTTMGDLLETAIEVTGADADLVWVDPEEIEKAGISPWTDLPIWIPPTGEGAGMHRGDVSAAYEAGLACRPIRETITDTWAWLQAEGEPALPPNRDPVGLDPEKERQVIG
jgi:nucleoside-diphosphate-sugar epimerase